MDARAFASPKRLRPRRRVKPAHDGSLWFGWVPGLRSIVGWAKAHLRRAHHLGPIRGGNGGTPPDAVASAGFAHPTDRYRCGTGSSGWRVTETSGSAASRPSTAAAAGTAASAIAAWPSAVGWTAPP